MAFTYNLTLFEFNSYLIFFMSMIIFPFHVGCIFIVFSLQREVSSSTSNWGSSLIDRQNFTFHIFLIFYRVSVPFLEVILNLLKSLKVQKKDKTLYTLNIYPAAKIFKRTL